MERRFLALHPVQANDADATLAAFMKTITTFEIPLEKITAVVIDNFVVGTCAMAKIPVRVVRCFAHSLALCVNASLFAVGKCEARAKETRKKRKGESVFMMGIGWRQRLL